MFQDGQHARVRRSMDPAFSTTRIRAFLPVFQRSAQKVKSWSFTSSAVLNNVLRNTAVSLMAEGTRRQACHTVSQRLSVVLADDT